MTFLVQVECKSSKMDLQYSIEDRSKHEQRPSSSSKRPRIDPVYSEEAEGVLRQEEQHIGKMDVV
jgi:hypothetical protein